jgi:hypothetical protein
VICSVAAAFVIGLAVSVRVAAQVSKASPTTSDRGTVRARGGAFVPGPAIISRHSARRPWAVIGAWRGWLGSRPRSARSLAHRLGVVAVFLINLPVIAVTW